MDEEIKNAIVEAQRDGVQPIVSSVLSDGSLVELLYRPSEHKTLFCIAKDGVWSFESSVTVNGKRYVPYSPHNNLIKNEVVLFPSEPEEYESEEALVREIQAFTHRYVDVTPLFEKIASYYVLLTWVYDAFSELPYLRLRGDPGSGKTRFLLAAGSLCYKPIFASGASTVSPLFRILDAVRGTLIIDEGDFRFSDEQAEIVKILNNGNAKGFPVLRSEVTGKHEYSPTAYTVFGPKVVATRSFFQDRALESRCLTEEMGQFKLREDIPINLTQEYKTEALRLRNKLLLFRIRNRNHCVVSENLVDRSIEPRLSQIFVPLLSVIGDEGARKDLQELAKQYNRELVTDRGMDTEAQVLEIIHEIITSREAKPSVKEITSWFQARYGEDYERKVTAKWIGSIIRTKLHLKTQKSDGVFRIPLSELLKLRRLFERYGIDTFDPTGTSGTS